MTELEVPTPAPRRDLSRRSVLKSAAWAAPVVAATVATPLASASITGSSVAWGDDSGRVADIFLLNQQGGGSVLNLNVLPFGPQKFTIYNPTPGAIEGPLTGRITITWSDGLPLLSCKGYGVYSVAGSTANVINRKEEYFGIGLIGTYNTTQDIVIPNGVSGSSLDVPVQFGMTNRGALGVSVIVTFTATLTVFDKNNNQIGSAATATLATPVGLNVL